jgi:hypothetical protein
MSEKILPSQIERDAYGGMGLHSRPRDVVTFEEKGRAIKPSNAQT